MRLKHFLLGAAVSVFSTGQMMAANPNATVDQVKIYINPGHGTYGVDDRHMATIKHGANDYTDTAGFYESNTNMQKAYGLLDKLKEYGVPYDPSKPITGTNQKNIRMSHATTGISPNLTTIYEEAQQMDADVFISIHSNANQGDANNPSGHTNFNQLLFLYRGWDGDPYTPGSDKMARACWNQAIKNKHMHWNWLSDPTHPYEEGSSNYVDANGNACTSFPGRNYYPSGNDADGNPFWIKGDVTFQYGYTDRNNSGGYTRYYRVLNHTIPGFLVEGYDHTYRPAMHRAMNDDVCRHEGELYACGLNDYFGWGKKDSYGKIYGIVRDQSVTMSETYYSVIQNPTRDANKYIDQVDNKKPLNNVKVTLYNSEGVAIDSYTTDDEWNGAYFFKKVAPGTYTIKHSLSGYTEVVKEVTVVANETNYIDIDMRSSSMARAVQGHYAYGLKLAKTDDQTYTASFNSTGEMSNGKIILTNSSTGETTTIETGAINAGANSVEIDATTLGDGVNYSWAVAFDNPQSDACELIYSDQSIVYNNGSANARIGVAIDKDQTSANFGTIYTLTAMGQGLQKYNPDFTKNGGKLITGMFGQDASSSTSSWKYYRSNRLEVEDGKVYIANYAGQNNGVWAYDPATGATPTLVSGNRYYERAIAFYGEGANRKAFGSHNDYQNVQRFDIGTNTTWTSGSPTKYYLDNVVMENGDGDIVVTDNAVIVSQHRYLGKNNSQTPAFIVLDHDMNLKYKSDALNATLNGTSNGGMAITPDYKTFAIVDGEGESPEGSNIITNNDLNVQVYSVTWNESTPSFSHQYSIPLTGTRQVDQMEFDYAGNLVIASQQQGLLVYAIKNPSRQTTTNGSGTITGVRPPTSLYIVGNSDVVGNWDPANAVEVAYEDKKYSITLNETVTEFKLSTAKGSWVEFDAGNLTTKETITNGGTVSLLAEWGGNFILPWAGVWNITVSSDLSTLTATTTTPKPLSPLYIVGNTEELGAWNTENAVEVSNDGYSYSITLDENVTAFKISTNKGDATTFNNGNLAVGSSIVNGVKVNLIADNAGEKILLPWTGVWNVTVAGDLSTLTASTSTPDPYLGSGIGAEPENAPNPDAIPGESEEAEDAQTEGYFAYDLQSSLSGNVYTFKFKSTGARKNGRIVLTNKSTGATIEIKTPIVKGQNSVTYNAYDIQKGDYTWAVKLTNNANSTVTQVGSNNSMVGSSARIGLAIDNDQTSKNFGTIYTHTSGSNGGVQKINPDMTTNGSKFLTGKFAGLRTDGLWSTRLEANSGKLYIAHYDNTNSGVWVYDPSKSQDATKVTISSDISAGVRGVAFNGTGSSRKMYILSFSLLHGYNIGSSDAGTSTVANNYSSSAGVMQAEGDLLVTEKGLLASQYRYSGGHTDDRPVFIFVDYSGNLVFKSTAIKETLKASERGAMAITSDYKTFAIVDGYESDANGTAIIKDIHVDIFNVSWNGNTPTFTLSYTIPLSGTRLVNQMEFDHAGNLLIASREKGILKYAVKTLARATVTNALSSYTISGLGRDAAPTNVVATRKCYDEGDNSAAGTVDAEITWKGDAGDYKVFYQTMRRDASGNREYDNGGTWVEAGTATIASGATTGKFTHKNLEAGSDYNRIYNYKVANYYPAASYASTEKFMEISGKGRTVTSAVSTLPVNVAFGQRTEEKDGITLSSLDLKLDLSLNETVFNATLLDDNDELVKATKYVVVVDEATAKALNAASNVNEVGLFYRGPATMTANNCNHYGINDWYMVVDFDDVTPADDLSKATKSLVWKDVDLSHTYKPQVYTSAVRTFNFTANDSESVACKIEFPATQWTANNHDEQQGANIAEAIPVKGDIIETLVGNEDYPMGTFQKIGDTENPTNPVEMTKANMIGATGHIDPLPVVDEILNEWDITYTLILKDKDGKVISEAVQESNATNKELYSNAQKRIVDILGLNVGRDKTTSPDGRDRYTYNAEKNEAYTLVVRTTYSKTIDGELVEKTYENESPITVNPSFPELVIDQYKTPGYVFLETSTHWDEKCKDENGYINGGYFKYYYDAVIDVTWESFDDDMVRYMGYYGKSSKGWDCIGHPVESNEWTPYQAASILTDSEVIHYNTRITDNGKDENKTQLKGVGYTKGANWSTLLAEENHIPVKVHYVWAGNEELVNIAEASVEWEVSANYPVVICDEPMIKVSTTANDDIYDISTPQTRSRSAVGGKDLYVITTTNSNFKTMQMDDIVTTKDTTTGVENVGYGNGVLRLFPNPVDTHVTLQAPIAITDVKIFSIDGQLVKEFDTDDTQVRLDVSDLTTGVYIVHAAGTSTRLIKK